MNCGGYGENCSLRGGWPFSHLNTIASEGKQLCKKGKTQKEQQSMDIEVNANDALNISVAFEPCERQQQIPKSHARTATLTHICGRHTKAETETQPISGVLEGEARRTRITVAVEFVGNDFVI